MSPQRTAVILCALALALFVSQSVALGQYIKHDPPPDANKPVTGADLSCWLATAANMLAGAGYGTGADEQARAEEIYDELRLELTGEG
jgi:hypothetical protein